MNERYNVGLNYVCHAESRAAAQERMLAWIRSATDEELASFIEAEYDEVEHPDAQNWLD